MTFLELWAFFLHPLALVGLGWVAVLLHERSLKRQSERE